VAKVIVVPTPDGCNVEEEPDLEPVASLDATRRLARKPGGRFGTPERVHDLANVLFAAEAVGMAGWCLDTASAYAKVREQFGRPIGQFQAVKHKCANMLVAV
jgi:alkylation response protein AidB-like acyl-CoA dehydrogenase